MHQEEEEDVHIFGLAGVARRELEVVLGGKFPNPWRRMRMLLLLVGEGRWIKRERVEIGFLNRNNKLNLSCDPTTD